MSLIETHEADNLSLVSIIVLVSLKIFFSFPHILLKKIMDFGNYYQIITLEIAMSPP